MLVNDALYILHTQDRTVTALYEGGQVCDLQVELAQSRSKVGSIFRAKVVRVLPSMQAAFVDIGLDKPAFLHRRGLGFGDLPIEKILHQGQSVMVQVTRAPRGHGDYAKGATVSTDIKLVSNSVVYFPNATEKQVLVSKQLRSTANYKQLMQRINEWWWLQKAQGSVLLRVSALNNESNLEQEIGALIHSWQQAIANPQSAPVELWSEAGLAERSVRDASDQCSIFWAGEDAENDQVLARDVVVLEPAQQADLATQLEQAISAALEREVSLTNGGQLVIDRTEAMTVVDVNTASAISGDKLIHQTNLLAAQEVARQLRLRNIGGIVIVDFIDDSNSEHQKQVLASLRSALAKDSARTTCAANSSLGLIEITRERQGLSLADQYLGQCPTCGSHDYRSQEQL